MDPEPVTPVEPDAEQDAAAAAADAPEARGIEEEVERLRLELERVREDAEAARRDAQGHLETARRALADFDNFRRRARAEAQAARDRAKEDVYRELLPALDNFDRALAHADDADALREGVQLIHRQLQRALEAGGLVRIPAEGEAFDPTRHEAIAREVTDRVKEGVVVQEIERGYLIGERVLRPARVKVAVAPQPGEAAAEPAPAPAPAPAPEPASEPERAPGE